MAQGELLKEGRRRLRWSERLSVGVAGIDAQHQELYRRIDQFLRALEERRARSEVTPLMSYLGQYIHEHFGAEQQMMELAGYGALGDHMAEHHWFEDEYRRLAAELEADGVSLALAQALVGLLVDWIDRHVETTDRAMGAFLTGRFRLGRSGPSA